MIAQRERRPRRCRRRLRFAVAGVIGAGATWLALHFAFGGPPRLTPDNWMRRVDSYLARHPELETSAADELETPIRFEANGLYGYKQVDGTIVIPARFRNAAPFVNGAARVQDPAGHFLIDPQGREVTLGRFDGVGDFYCDRATVAMLRADGLWKYGYADRRGQVVIAIEFDYAQDFYRGFALVARGPGFIKRVQAKVGSGQVDWDCVVIDRQGKRVSLD